MSVSTDAIVVYGVQLDMDEGEAFPGQPEDEDDYEEGSDAPWCLAYHGGAGGKVELVVHCHCDYPMYIVAAAGTERKAWRGEPVELGELIVPDGADEAIAAYCERWGLKIKSAKPTWLLCSYWDG